MGGLTAVPLPYISHCRSMHSSRSLITSTTTTTNSCHWFSYNSSSSPPAYYNQHQRLQTAPNLCNPHYVHPNQNGLGISININVIKQIKPFSSYFKMRPHRGLIAGVISSFKNQNSLCQLSVTFRCCYRCWDECLLLGSHRQPVHWILEKRGREFFSKEQTFVLPPEQPN